VIFTPKLNFPTAGKPITTAIYSNIEAIARDRFVCGLTWDKKVNLDEKGKSVGR